MIQGPTALDWSRRRYGILPGIDNADLQAHFPPTVGRLDLWLRAGVCVAGRPDWRFVKLHTHRAPEHSAAMLLGEPMRRFHEGLARISREDSDFRYYYVTAREMADLVHQAERARNGAGIRAGERLRRVRRPQGRQTAARAICDITWAKDFAPRIRPFAAAATPLRWPRGIDYQKSQHAVVAAYRSGGESAPSEISVFKAASVVSSCLSASSSSDTRITD